MALRLFVGNLPHSATDAELTDLVTNGGFQVASAVVIRDRMTGDSKGFGFVELADGQDLQKAIDSLNGQKMDGRPLTVSEARPQPQRSGFGPRGGGYGGGGHGHGGGAGRGGFSKRRRDW